MQPVAAMHGASRLRVASLELRIFIMSKFLSLDLPRAVALQADDPIGTRLTPPQTSTHPAEIET